MTIPIHIEFLAFPLLTLLLYWRCLNGPPIFDDQESLNQKFSWHTPRVLSEFSLHLQRIWPNTFRGIHVGNCLIHALCAGLVEQIARASGVDTSKAMMAGVFYCVMPFAVNTVGYITGRASLLAAVFGLSAVLSVVSGYGWLAPLFVALAYFSKQDGLGYGVTIAILYVWNRQWLLLAVLVLLTILAYLRYRKYFAYLMRITGDVSMAASGLPVSLPQPYHGMTVFTETILRIPRWFFGWSMSPYPGSGIRFPSAWRYFTAVVLLCVLLFKLDSLPFLLILTGPWLLYLIVRVPDQLMEYRDYHMVAGFALLWVDLPWWAWIVASGYCAALTVVRSESWESPIAMWTEAARTAVGDKSRALQEWGIWLKISGKSKESEAYFREALVHNPRLAPAMDNLSGVLIETGRLEEALMTMETCQKRCPNYSVGWERLGMLYEMSQKFPAAMASYSEAFRQNPKAVMSANRLGMLLHRDRRFDDAAVWFDRARAVRPDIPDFIYNAARNAGASGNREKESELLAVFGGKPLRLTTEMLRPETMAC